MGVKAALMEVVWLAGVNGKNTHHPADLPVGAVCVWLFGGRGGMSGLYWLLRSDGSSQGISLVLDGWLQQVEHAPCWWAVAGGLWEHAHSEVLQQLLIAFLKVLISFQVHCMAWWPGECCRAMSRNLEKLYENEEDHSPIFIPTMARAEIEKKIIPVIGLFLCSEKHKNKV